MRILLVSQYFYPENFKFNDLAEDLSKDNEVVVLTGKPNYPRGDFFPGYKFLGATKEQYKNITIYRAPLIPRKNNKLFLTLNYISFALFSSLFSFFFYFTKRKFDKILVCQVSPIFMVLPAITLRWLTKTPVILWITDLWPESLSATGVIKNRLILNLVEKFAAWAYRNVDEILVSCKGFEQSIKMKSPDSKIEYYPYWAEDFYKVVPKDVRFNFLNTFILMFAGNIGEAQNLKLLVQAANRLRYDYKFLVVIAGDGRAIQELKNHIVRLDLEKFFHFCGSYRAEEMPGIYAHADALYLSLRKDPIFEITVPSKLQSYMACAKPILASIDGEAAEVIEQSLGGMVSPAEDLDALVKNMQKMINLSAHDKLIMGESAHQYYKSHFDRSVSMKKIRHILSQA